MHRALVPPRPPEEGRGRRKRRWLDPVARACCRAARTAPGTAAEPGFAERASSVAEPGSAERASSVAEPGSAERAGTVAEPGSAERAGTVAEPCIAARARTAGAQERTAAEEGSAARLARREAELAAKPACWSPIRASRRARSACPQCCPPDRWLCRCDRPTDRSDRWSSRRRAPGESLAAS